RGVTVTLNTEFLAPGQIGDFIIATGETTKVGGGLVFARGLITAEDRTLMSFSGALKRLRD
ncbi:MAG: PaaI family thioesterase, partial [Parvularculaceae bacterium]